MKKIDHEIDEDFSILLEDISYSCSRLLKLEISTLNHFTLLVMQIIIFPGNITM